MAKINGKTVKLAVFDEQGQKDLESGNAVFNNGYRKKTVNSCHVSPSLST